MNCAASHSRRNSGIIIERRSSAGFIGEINECIIIANENRKGYLVSCFFPVLSASLSTLTEIELPYVSSLVVTERGPGMLPNVLDVSLKSRHM